MVAVSRIRRTGAVGFSLLLFALSLPLSLFLSRIYYVFFQPEALDGGKRLLDFTVGGYGLFGAVFGTVIVAVILGLVDKNLTARSLLDAMTPGALLAVGIGRFSAGFSEEEMGVPIDSGAFSQISSIDGKRYLSVYIPEGIVALFLCAVALAVFVFAYRKGKEHGRGITATIGASLYCAFQIVFESMRTDALYLKPFNLGFVKASQFVAALIIVAIAAVMYIKAFKLRLFHIGVQSALWALTIAAVAFCFYTEYSIINSGGGTIGMYLTMLISALFVSLVSCCIALKSWYRPTKSGRQINGR